MLNGLSHCSKAVLILSLIHSTFEQKSLDPVSLLIFALCVNSIYVSGHYTKYNSDDDGFKPIRPSTDNPIEQANQAEYEYYDDEDLDATFAATTATTTTTTTTTTQRPVSTQRLSTRRSSFRSLNFNKKKIIEKPFTDSYTEASDDFEIVQQPAKLGPSILPHLRNTIFDVDRRENDKSYNFGPEKSSTASELNNGNGNFSRRYARFLFKLRTG